MFRDQPAELNGERVYELYNALGDGTVKFTGNLQTPIGKGRLIYEGYTRTAPFDGRLFVDTGPYGGNVYAISILDNTSGQFVIYDGTPTLSAPSEWGNFRCRWVQLR